MPRPPQKVDFLRKRHDYMAALLGALGFATAYIQDQTTLSKCQVEYRLRKLGIKRLNYRQGDSVTAQMVLKVARSRVGDWVRSQAVATADKRSASA